VTADKHITLMCGGGYIKLEGGNIDVVMPGTFTVKAAEVDFKGPDRLDVRLPLMPGGLLKWNNDFCLECFLRAAHTGNAAVPA
jgi:uncharacterized protein (DUF2345 family)